MLVRMTELNMPQAFEIIGDPGWIRTSDLQLRRLLLCHFNPVLSIARKVQCLQALPGTRTVMKG